MDDHKFDDLLDEMKKDYENVPEYIDEQTVMANVLEDKNRKTKKIAPFLAAVAGLFLFVVITYAFMDTEKQQADEPGATLEQYFLESKENFRKSLGLSEVDGFPAVEEAEKWSHRNTGTVSYENQFIVERIDELLQTPEMAMTEINKNKLTSKEQYFAIEDLMLLMMDLKPSLQKEFNRLIEEHEIDQQGMQTILNGQFNPDGYDGPLEITEYLKMLNNQGYFLVENYMENLSIKLYPQWITENIQSNHEENQGFMEYLKLLSTMIDFEYPGIGNEYGYRWTEFDDILLAFEDFYQSLDELENQNLHFLDGAFHTITKYLNDYLSASKNLGGQLDEAAREELLGFRENHKNSVFWGLVNSAIYRYGTNNWRWGQYDIQDDLVRLFFQEKMDTFEFNDIIQVKPLPVRYAINQLYEDYKVSNNDDLLKNTHAFEMMRLYMYAYEKDDFDTYYHMYSKETVSKKEKLREEIIDLPRMDFKELSQKTDFILVKESQDGKRIKYTFLSTDFVQDQAEILGLFKLNYEEGIWRIPFMPMHDSES